MARNSASVKAQQSPPAKPVLACEPAPLWPRLGYFTAAAMPDEECLWLLIERLQSDQPLTARERDFAASYFRRIVLTPAARAAITGRSRGRPASNLARYVAIHYAVAKELKQKNAAKSVAAIWELAHQYVKDAHRAHQAAARAEIDKIIAMRLAGPSGHVQPDGSWLPRHWTRGEILEAMALDLADRARRNK